HHITTNSNDVTILKCLQIYMEVTFKVIQSSLTRNMDITFFIFDDVIIRNIINFIFYRTKELFVNILISNNTTCTTVFINNQNNWSVLRNHQVQNILNWH